jgi:hypothetical protein
MGKFQRDMDNLWKLGKEVVGGITKGDDDEPSTFNNGEEDNPPLLILRCTCGEELEFMVHSPVILRNVDEIENHLKTCPAAARAMKAARGA